MTTSIGYDALSEQAIEPENEGAPMKVIVVNGTYRPEGSTTELSRAFMEGVREAGGEAEMILLRDYRISSCTNCLQCYAFTGAGIAPCSIRDDMDTLVPKIAEADGVLFASPVHSGFVTGLLTSFNERMVWRMLRPGGRFCGICSLLSRLDDKVRAVGSIVSAGGMPEGLGSRFCNDGTAWLKGNLPLELHGQWIGGLYAGAELERTPESERDWQRVYFLRKVSDRQREQARALGLKMINAIDGGRMRASTMQTMMPAPIRWVAEKLAPRSRYGLTGDA